MEFWNELITNKSWDLLVKLNKKIDFVLIGGWAVYLWTKGMKSKDIDIIVSFDVLEKLKQEYNLKKNNNLKKYELVLEEIDVDIYVPFFSQLPLLQEDLRKYTTSLEGMDVMKVEPLLILKQNAELSRRHSLKGEKDRLDILSLLVKCKINFSEYELLLGRCDLSHYKKRLMEIIKNFRTPEKLGLTPREYKLKKNFLLKHI